MTRRSPGTTQPARLSLILGLLALLAGCGGSDGGASTSSGTTETSSTTTSTVTFSPNPAATSGSTGNVLVTNQVAPGAQAAGATQYVYTAFDASHQLVYGPVSDPPETEQLLQNVPIEAKALNVDYYGQNGEATGYTEDVPISVQAGATTKALAAGVSQPNQWTAHGPYARSYSPFSHSVGVCYAGPGTAHPSVQQDLDTLVNTDGFKMLHIYHLYSSSSAPFQFDPSIKAVLDHAQANNVEILLGTLNSDVTSTFQTVGGADAWLTQLKPYLTAGVVKAIALANEPNDRGQANIQPATFATAATNLRQALTNAGFPSLPITTCLVYGGIVSYPPAAARFQDDGAALSMQGYIQALVSTNASPFVFVNILPSYTVTSVVRDVPSTASWYPQFGLFTSTTDPAQNDGNLNPYWALADLQYNTVLTALEVAGMPQVQVYIGESGWPSGGNGSFTTPQNEATYINNLLAKWILPQATAAGRSVPTFLFEAYDEPERDPTQADWGLRTDNSGLKAGISIPSWVSTQ
jgi:hypothetical protein